jgi:hypothetical protein
MTSFDNIEKSKDIVTARFLEPGFEYWFSNHEKFRTPFPPEIRELLKERTKETFFDWFFTIKDDEKAKMEENELAEMFEMILFNEAIKLVENEDQKLGISYPFIPKIGDRINHTEKGEGIVEDRKLILTKENKNIIELSISFANTKQIWKTAFEITE